MVRRALGLLFFLSGLTGCTTTPVDEVPLTLQILDDSRFPSYSLFSVETEETIFHLDEEAKQFVHSALSPHRNYEQNINSLIDAIFSHSENGITYRGNANLNANNTFHEQVANCLSLSIMTYAMARYAGFEAKFFEVEVPEYWTRRDGFNLLNGHINLQITIPEEVGVIRLKTDFIDVDFDPQDVRNHFPRYAVSKDRVVAMFYTNKGAEALIENSYSKAYAYFRQAALSEPDFESVWINLGVLYRMNGFHKAAEKSYLKAIAMNDENLTAWENLAILYQRTDRRDQAQDILARLESKRKNNPFYHFILGEQEMETGNYQLALTHYRRAHRLDEKWHEVLFALGKAYYELGDISQAARYLERAARFAVNAEDESRYQGKLALLQSGERAYN